MSKFKPPVCVAGRLPTLFRNVLLRPALRFQGRA